MKGYTKQLNEYSQAWPQIIPSMYTNSASQQPLMQLFNIGPVQSNFTKLPAAPFLVPAIIEALCRSKRYENIVEVVPGEADLYCANHVRSHGGVVLTGDSDLLIHELGNGAVSFFKNIHLAGSGDETSLKCTLYQVSAIVQRLGLSEPHGLTHLAFEMAMDAHGTFRELLQKAVKLNAVSTHDTMYQEFMSEYKALQSTGSLKKTGNIEDIGPSLPLSRQLKRLDPRISEYLLQFPNLAQAAGVLESCWSDYGHYDDQIDIFLPFVLDCPVRTSSWEMSSSIRQLAYGLVNMLLPLNRNVLKVTEYRRLQNGSKAREWQIPSAQDVPKASADLVELFRELRSGISALPAQDIWRALAIYQDQELSSSTGKPRLSSIAIQQSKNGKAFPFRLTWDGIHLNAQFQGSYYSFRILKQILEVVLLYDDTKNLPLALHQLHMELESLPSLEDLPPLVDAIRNTGDLEDQVMLEMIQKLLGINAVEEWVKTPGKKNKKKRKVGGLAEASKDEEESKHREESNSRGEPHPKRKGPNNIFEVLQND